MPDRRLLVVISAVILACLGASIATVALRPRAFTTRREAVSYVLAQRGLVVEEFYLDRRWPDSVNTIVFGSVIQIRMRDIGWVNGRFDCEQGERSCWIMLPKLGIDRLPVPDLSTASDPPLLEWIDARLADLKALVLNRR